MIRVLLYTDAITLLSGLARCAREMAGRFHHHPEYQVTQAGWHSIGMPHSYPIQIFPIMRGQSDESERLFQIIARTAPHYVLAIGDTFYFHHLHALKERLARDAPQVPPVKWIGWITVDGDPLMLGQLQNILAFDALAPMSRFAEGEIRKAMLKARNAEDFPYADRLDVPMQTIYPGVDHATFQPKGVTWTWNDQPIRRGTHFVCTVIDQNTSRKAIPNAIEAFAVFCKDKPDAILYLGTDPNDPNGTNLVEILDHLGIRDRAFIRYNSPIGGMSDEELSNVYNVSSVLFSCTSGEGFKMPILEAMRSFCLNVMPDYTAPSELLEDGRGILVPAEGHWTGSNNFHKRVVLVPRMVEGLNRAYDLYKNKPEDLGKILDRAYKFSTGCTWDRTFLRFDQLMRGLYLNRTLRVLAA